MNKLETEKMERVTPAGRTALDYLEEAEGWVGLRNYEEARRVTEEGLRLTGASILRHSAMMLALRFDDIATAGRHAWYLYCHHLDEFRSDGDLAMVLDYAGYSREAYELAVVARDDGFRNATYNLACRACSVCRLEEALRALLDYFQNSADRNSPSWRKIVLDSDLLKLWDYMAARPVSAADALRWSGCPLEFLVFVNKPALPPRFVDWADLPRVPAEFLPFLAPSSMNTKCFLPGKGDAAAEVFQKYLDWEAGAVEPAVEALRGFARRLRARYDEMLPGMLAFCAGRGRPGTARFLLRQFIRRHGGRLTPDQFPPIPGLEYWSDEWRRLHAIDPEGTFLLIDRRPDAEDGGDFLDNVFSKLPEPLRESGLGWFVALCELMFLDRWEEALFAGRMALRYWPGDEALIINLISCLARLGRWDDALRVATHPDFLRIFRADPAAAGWITTALEDKSTKILPPNRESYSHFPLPSYGLMDDAEDIRFLKDWHRHCVPAIKRVRAAKGKVCTEA